MRFGSFVDTLAHAAVALAVAACAPRPELPPRQPSTPPPARPSGVASAVVLVAIDGLRWQEVVSGADRTLITDRRGGVRDTAAALREFWRDDARERRRLLMPFVWSMMTARGQLFGDPSAGSPARVTNTFRFSYPGYSEMFTGVFDPRIDSNEYPPNPNETVFEWLAGRPGRRGSVAAFATWSAFRRILNAERAGFPVRDGWDAPFDTLRPANERQATINELYRTSVRLWPDNAFDAPMYLAAHEYVRAYRPRVLFLGFGETDEWAHEGRYDLYLQAARQTDAYIADLWRTMAAMSRYRNGMAFVVTTDHGRGNGPDGWRNHGRDVDGAEAIWIAVFGSGVPALGPRANMTATQSQVAATIAWLLGENWLARRPDAGPPLPLTADR